MWRLTVVSQRFVRNIVPDDDDEEKEAGGDADGFNTTLTSATTIEK